MKTILRFLLLSLILTFSAAAQHFLELPETWKFRLDSANIGVSEHWYTKDLDDSKWSEIKVGDLWESQGYDYDGYAWYRLKFTLPRDWGTDKILLIFGGVDDIYDVYLNGKFVASHGSLDNHVTVYNTFTSTDLTSSAGRSGENTLAVRVYDWGGGGGIWRQPIAIVSDVKPFLPGEEYLREAALKHPEWALPRWARKQGLGWTMVGMENGVHEVLRSIDGSFGSTAWPFTVSVWLLDPETKELHAPELLSASECSASMKKGYIPISLYSYPAGNFSVESRLFVNSQGDIDADAVAYCNVTVRSNLPTSRDAKLVVAIRPYRVNAHTGGVKSIRYEKTSTSLAVNDSISVLFDKTPEGCKTAIVNKEGDISGAVMREEVESSNEVHDKLGLASCAVILPMKFSESKRSTSITMRIPLAYGKRGEQLEQLRGFSASAEEADVTRRWENRLEKLAPRFHLPDKDFENAYYASLAYILISMDKGMLHPGPLAYDYFWYRDGAYMTNALLQAGFVDLVKPILQVFMKPQLPTGEFPSIFDINYRGFGPHEWDAQGQALFALAQYYRYTHDKEFVRQFWGNITKAVDFIKSTRAQRLTKAHEGSAIFGILPPSESAEDLGPATWHHYWDDFWCIKGLYDASFLARELGEEEKGKEFQYEADELLKWTKSSYTKVMRDSSIDWIPNGPEDIRGTSMARGTGPALWPGQVLDTKDEAVQTSFQRYYEKWIKPFKGAYLHQGRFWPYGFELAQCYTFLGRREIANEILRWHLQHQTFPGAYSWAEQIDTTSLWFAAGDMPHCWVAADFMNALRSCLLYEDNGRIVLAAGVSRQWLDGGKKIRVESAPTFFGMVSYTVSVSSSGKKISLKLSGTAQPPKGYAVRLPIARENIQKVIAGRHEIRIGENGEFFVDAVTRSISVTLK